MIGILKYLNNSAIDGEQSHELRIKYLKRGLGIAIILSPLFSVLDYILYPLKFWAITALRYALELSLLLMFYSLFTSLKKYVRLTGVLTILSLSGAFCAMVFFTDGMRSTYYAGINLSLLMALVLLNNKKIDTMTVCIGSLVMYATACLLHDGAKDWINFANNLFFLIGTAVICASASYFHEEIRQNNLMLARELEAKNAQLAKLDQLKSNFFANISHELRTPLTLILAPVQDLLKSGSHLPAQVAEVLGLVRSNGLRLLKLVNDLLEVIRLEEGKFALEKKPLDVIDLVRGVIDSMSQLATMQGVVLVDVLPEQRGVVLGSHAALEKVFFNLLSNAVKFTPQGGSIRVGATWLEKSIQLSVSDTGVGIEPHAMPYIFDKFHQGDNSATRKHQGTGLGLALVKDLVGKHAGQVDVVSQLHVGTEMLITLPLLETDVIQGQGGDSLSHKADHVDADDKLTQLYRAAEQGAGLGHSMPRHLELLDMQQNYVEGSGEVAPIQLVLAEDEPEMRRYLGKLLKEHWHMVQTDNGQSAWELIEKHRPPLAVLDVMMPQIDGLQLCQKIKANPATAHTKVLMLTARADEGAKLEALSYGADDFLTKPFSTSEVQTRLKNLFENYQLNQSLQAKNADLTQTLGQLRQTQQELIHSEKINSLGIMAAGLLHEINNPLNFMMMAFSSMKRRNLIPEDGKLQDMLTDIEDGTKRISQIVSDLRTFAYPSVADQKQAFHTRQAVDSALRFTAHERGSAPDIEVQVLQQEDDMAMASETHVVQVLINLLNNAYKAIHALKGARRGKITITLAARGEWMLIQVQDNGEGIPPEKIKHVFDPFFTTSAPGQGTGLGLSICHTIMRNQNGSIVVESTLGECTTFTLELPRK